MKRIEDQPAHVRTRAKQVLLWISHTMRPISVEELQHALSVELGMGRLDQSAIPARSRLTSVCAGLVTIDQESQIIRLVHETAQSYLEERSMIFFPKAQEDIAKICLTYLSFDTFSTGRCSSDELFEGRLQEHALLEYAARYWGKHAKGGAELSVKDLALQFLRDDQKVSCATQVMMSGSYRYPGYSQFIPKNVSNLHICSFFGLKDTLDELLRYSDVVDPKDTTGRTPLCCAAENGHEAVVKLLVDSGAAVDSVDEDGSTPLLRAVEKGHEAVVKLLLDKGWAVDSENNRGMTPLSLAAEKGHEAVVKLLLDNGTAVDSVDGCSETPLLRAAEKGHEAVVKLLLEKGAAVDSVDMYGWTPLLRAARNGHEAVVKLLQLQGPATVSCRAALDHKDKNWTDGGGTG